MFVDDYRPTKRVGVEELDGACRIIQRELDGLAMERASEENEREFNMMCGAWLALHLVLTGRFQYPEDFVRVLKNKIEEVM